MKIRELLAKFCIRHKMYSLAYRISPSTYVAYTYEKVRRSINEASKPFLDAWYKMCKQMEVSDEHEDRKRN